MMFLYAYALLLVGLFMTAATLFYEDSKPVQWTQFVAKTLLGLAIILFTQTRDHKHMSVVTFSLTVLPAILLFMNAQGDQIPRWLQRVWVIYRVLLLGLIAFFSARLLRRKPKKRTAFSKRV